MNAPDPRDSDRGYTLLELLAAMAIMSIAFAAIFAGLGMFLRTETVQRNQSQLDVSLRSYAEQLMGVTYVACATPATPTYAAVSVPRDVHNTAYTKSVTIKYWNGDLPATWFTTTPTCVPSADKGLQQITITLTGSDGEKGTLTIGKTQ